MNKSKRQLFPIVSQRMVLSDGLAKYMGLLGLEKRRKPPASLSEYLTKPHEPPNGQPTTATSATKEPGTPATPSPSTAHTPLGDFPYLVKAYVAWSCAPSDGSANGVSKNSANRSFKNAINAGSNA